MRRGARAAAGLLALGVAACGGGGGGGGGGGEGPPPAPATYAVQGLVNGLAEGSTLTLLLNGQPALSLSRNGEFRLSQVFRSGDSYQLSVAAPAGAVAQTCSVQGGVGTIGGDVSNVVVGCSTLLFKLGGQVSGLRSSGLVLRSLRGDELTVAADGRFEFAGAVPSGAGYGVLIAQQPGGVPAQTCTVSQGSGTVAAADINDVAVVCSTNTYRVGGTVEGLRGTGLQLQLNGDAVLARHANGSFVFEQPLASASGYLVTVKTQPYGPTQTCSVADGSGAGVVGRGDESGVRVVCSTNSYTVGGMVEGLVGSGLVLRNNGADDLPIASNGFFAFPQKVASGGAYTITVRSQPEHPRQTCSISRANGHIGDVEEVGARVSCSTLAYPLTVHVNGLRAGHTGLVLRNNGSDDLVVLENGSVTFWTRLVSDAPYAVTVVRQPFGPLGGSADDIDFCAVRPGTASGTIDPEVPASVFVDCARARDVLILRVSGLDGAGLRVKDAVRGTSHEIAAGGDFLLEGYPAGSGYRFLVEGQPAAQSCFVSNAEGTVGGTPPFPVVTIGCSARAGLAMLLVDGGGDRLELLARRENGIWQYLTFAPTGGRQPTGLALSPSRRHVYVSNVQSRTLATFELDPVGGTLRRIGLTATEALPWSLQMHPSGRFLYVKSADTSQVQVFSLDAISGLPTSSGPANRLGRDMVLDPAGRSGQMLAPAGGLFSFEIDSPSGGIVPIAGEPRYAADSYFLGKLVMAPSGGHLLAASLDPQTGGQGIALWRRDPASGLMLGLPERPQAVGFDDTRTVMSLALSPTGRYMVFVREDLRTYPDRFGNPTIHFAAIDPGTGRVSYSAALGQQVVLERLNRFVDVWHLTFDPSEKLVYVSRGDGHVDTYAIEPQDGSIRPSYGINVHPEHVSYSPRIGQTVVFELRPETAAQARARLRKPAAPSRALKAPARAPGSP